MHRPPSPSPRLDQAVYPAHAIAVMVRTLVHGGVAAADALRGSGLDEPALLRPATRISLGQMLTVFRNAHTLSPDPGLAVCAGSQMHIAACGIYGYALLSGATHGEVTSFIVRYDHMISPFTRMRFALVEDWSTWTVEMLPDLSPRDPLYRFILEFKLRTMLAVQHDLYGRVGDYERVRVMCPAPADPAAFAEAMGCEVLYDCEVNEIRFPARHMARPMTYADRITHETMRELCDQALLRIGGRSGMVDTVHSMLIGQPGRFPDIAAMARALSMNARTLQRKLEAEGSSYRDILAEARAHLATSYLRSTNLTIEEISSRVGYSDSANFRHAFTRWTGLSPGEFRRAHGGATFEIQ